MGRGWGDITSGRMKSSPQLSGPAQAALLALAVLGLLAMCLVAAKGGFTHSDKRATSSVFVAAPEAYLAAIPFLAMSILALVAVLRARKASAKGYILASAMYIALGCIFYFLAH